MKNRKEFFDIEQCSEEWFKIRLGLFTSSKVFSLYSEPRSKADKLAGILSATAETYIEEKACEIIYNSPSEIVHSKPTEWGTMTEDMAAEAYQYYSGNELKKVGFIRLVGEETGTSPDRYASTNGLAEIKCPYNRTNHIKNILSLKTQSDLLKLRKEYYIQIQHQMYVTGKDWCDFVSFDPRLLETKDNWKKSIHVLRIEKDSFYQDSFEEKIKIAADHRDYILKQIIV